MVVFGWNDLRIERMDSMVGWMVGFEGDDVVDIADMKDTELLRRRCGDDELS